jgi:hypothetical protein
LVGTNDNEPACCSVSPNTNSIRIITHGTLERDTRNAEDLEVVSGWKWSKNNTTGLKGIKLNF